MEEDRNFQMEKSFVYEKLAQKALENIGKRGIDDFSGQHWRSLKTNEPLERFMREIRRRTRVVGAVRLRQLQNQKRENRTLPHSTSIPPCHHQGI